MMNQGLTDGLRQTQWDVTFKVDRDLFTFLVNTFYADFPTVQDAESFFPSISIQAITAGQLKGMQKNGGNALGLDPSKGPFFVMNMSSRWAKANCRGFPRPTTSGSTHTCGSGRSKASKGGSTCSIRLPMRAPLNGRVTSRASISS